MSIRMPSWSLIQRIKNSEFALHVSTLATGSLLAQGITLGAAPFLTRLYGPESFAVLALFMAIAGTAASGASGRYDVALVVAKDDKDCDGLLALSFWTAGFVSSLIFLFLFFEDINLKKILNAESLGVWWLLIPIFIFITASGTTLKYYANRTKNYLLISRISVGQALLNITASLFFGFLGFTVSGLILALFLSAILLLTLLIYNFKKYLNNVGWAFNKQKIFLAFRYKQFPLYNASTTFLDSLTIALPVFFLMKYYPESIVGYYSLLTRVATAPLGFIAQSVSQVHIRKVAEQIGKGEDPSNYLLRISILLTGVAILPTVILMLYAPAIFEWIFGTQWRTAGELLVILMPALSLKFVVSTVSGVFSGTGNSHLAGFWKIAAFLITFLMFWLFVGKLNIRDLFLIMMITDVLLYSFYYYLVWYAIKNPKKI